MDGRPPTVGYRTHTFTLACSLDPDDGTSLDQRPSLGKLHCLRILSTVGANFGRTIQAELRVLLSLQQSATYQPAPEALSTLQTR